MLYLRENLVTKDTTIVSRLAERLRFYIDSRNWNLREAEDYFKISRSRLSDLQNDKADAPEVETLARLAAGFGVPLWQVIEEFGIDLGLSQAPSDLSMRLAQLIEVSPEYAPLGPYLMMLRPEDLRGLLAFLEAQKSLRERDQSGN